MEKKLQELTEKIYSEGIEKAKVEADTILADAKAAAEKQIKDAEAESEKIISEAKKTAEEIKRNGESEMKLAAKQALSEVKQKITDVVSTGVLSNNVKSAVADVDFIKKTIELMIKGFDPEGAMDLEVILPEAQKKELADYLKANSAKLMNAGLNIELSSEMTNGFKIGPADGSYKLSFTDDDFENFFKRYLRPKTATLLFEGE